MAKVKVRNLDHREYTEEFRDEMIVIPGNGYIEMGRSEALSFLGQATPRNVDGSGRCIKPKMLKLEEDPEVHAAQRDQPLRFTAVDGTQFRTEAGLNAHNAKLQAEAKEVEDAKPVRRRRAPNTTTTEAKPV
jgi:hypothetical protein